MSKKRCLHRISGIDVLPARHAGIGAVVRADAAGAVVGVAGHGGVVHERDDDENGDERPAYPREGEDGGEDGALLADEAVIVARQDAVLTKKREKRSGGV